MDKKQEKIREFPNGLSARVNEIETISEHLHEFKYKALDQEPEPCWLDCEYKEVAERLYELLGGYDRAMTFINDLKLVDPKMLLELIGERD
jgi:hypothetical protein